MNSNDPGDNFSLKVYPDISPAEVVAAFRSENILEVLRINLHNLMWRWYDFIPSGRPFKVLGLFFMGYYLFYCGFFTNHAKRWSFLAAFLAAGLGATALSMYLGGSVAEFSRSWPDIVDKLVHEIGQLSLALSYVCILARLVDAAPGFFVFSWLKDYGRMSMTSYLGQTFLGIVAFYPIIGWGYFGSLPLEKVFYIGMVLLAVQILFSRLWFRFFSFGPVEWLWRCATYGRFFRLTVSQSSTTPAPGVERDIR